MSRIQRIRFGVSPSTFLVRLKRIGKHRNVLHEEAQERKDGTSRKTTFTECLDWSTAVIMNEYTSRGRGVRADGDSSIRTSAFGG